MADNVFGSAIFRLVVDNKAFAEGLKQALSLVSVANTQFKDLTSLKIAKPDFSAIDLELTKFDTKISDVVGRLQTLPEQIPAAAKPPEIPAPDDKKVKSATEATREFLREQRFQDRVLSTGKESVIALTTGLGFLAMGNEGAEATTRSLERSLLAGIVAQNGLETALFGVGQAGARLPGIFGRVAVSAAAMAGPISAVVGVGTVLTAMIMSANDEAEKAAEEGLARFNSVIEKMSTPQKIALADELVNMNEQLLAGATRVGMMNLLLDKMPAQLKVMAGIRATPFTEEDVENIKALGEAYDALGDKTKEQVEKLKDEVTLNRAIYNALRNNNSSYIQTEATLLKISESLRLHKDLISGEALEDKDVKDLLDQQEQLLREKNKLNRSSTQILADELSILEKQVELGTKSRADLADKIREAIKKAELQKDESRALQLQIDLERVEKSIGDERLAVARARYEAGIGSVAVVLREHDAQVKAAKTDVDRLNAARERQEFIDNVANREAEREERRRSALEKERQMLNEMQEMSLRLTIENTTNEFDRRRQAEIQQHARTMSDIDEQKAAGLDDALAKKNADDEVTRHKRANLKIDADEKSELADFEAKLLGQSLAGDLERINNTYDEEAKRAQQLYKEKDDLNAALARIEKNRQDALLGTRVANFIEGLSSVEAGLTSLYDQSRARDIEAVRNKYDAERQAIESQSIDQRSKQAQLTALRKREEAEIQQIQNSGVDKFVTKLIQGLKAAKEIVEAIARIQAAMEAGKGVAGGDILGILGGFLSIFSIFAAEGGELPGGSYVVNAEQSKKHAPLLDLLQATTVVGGMAGKDSVPFTIAGGGMAMLTPGERIVRQQYAPIAKAINEGVVFRATGGPVDYLTRSVKTSAPYIQYFAEGGTLEAMPGISREIYNLALSGISNNPMKEAIDDLRSEFRALRGAVDEMKSEVQGQRSEVGGLRQDFAKGVKTDLDNGKMFFREHIGDALEFEREISE